MGCGQMGSGIAYVSAVGGLDVVVCETSTQAAEAGLLRLDALLQRAARGVKLDDDGIEQVRSRLRVSDRLDELGDRDLVIEAISEDAIAKTEVFRLLDAVVASPDAILASNTSSIPIMKLAMATSRPEQVLGIHFFNPVPVLRLVELVPSLVTAPITLTRATAFVETALNKTAIRSTDRAGFIVNALLIPYLLSAIRMLESGFASANDIDTGMVLGCAHPMGPLHLADLIGLDTTLAVAESLYEEFKEPLYAPPPLLCRMVDAGHLGRKAGRGFFEHPHP